MVRLEGVADPDDHFGFGGQGQNLGVKNFRACGCESVRLIVGEFMEQAGFCGFARIGGVDAVDVGPDDKFVGVDDVGDERAGEIGAVAAQGGDAAIGG
jgi:hypothetical protein